jgi:polyisoprenoid-binding protein YceI
MQRCSFKLFLWLALGLAALAFADTKAPRTYTLDLAQSQLSLTLGQEGMIGKRYPTHLVVVKNFSCNITLPHDEKLTSVALEAEAKSFTNADKLMSEFERRGFHDVLQTKVLESERYPTIKFKSVSVSGLKKNGATRAFTLHGELGLHGVTKRVAFPVTVTLANDQLRATGETSLKQSEYGMQPYEGNMGLIKISDELKINFSLTAKLNPDGGSKK